MLATGERIRLAEIDAPELDQPYGPEARDALRDILDSGLLIITPTGRDFYGRTLAHLTVDGQDVERTLISIGAAWCYVRYLPRDSDCPRREATARAEHRGVWSAPDPVPPWEWRRQRAKK